MLKRLVLRVISRILQRYFVGRKLYRMGDLDGQKAILSFGRIVGFDRRRLEVTFVDNGGNFKDGRRVHLTRLRRDNRMKEWVFYD